MMMMMMINHYRMLWIIAIINFIYAPLMIFLRNPPGKEEKQVRFQIIFWNWKYHEIRVLFTSQYGWINKQFFYLIWFCKQIYLHMFEMLLSSVTVVNIVIFSNFACNQQNTTFSQFFYNSCSCIFASFISFHLFVLSLIRTDKIR